MTKDKFGKLHRGLPPSGGNWLKLSQKCHGYSLLICFTNDNVECHALRNKKDIETNCPLRLFVYSGTALHGQP